MVLFIASSAKSHKKRFILDNKKAGAFRLRRWVIYPMFVLLNQLQRVSYAPFFALRFVVSASVIPSGAICQNFSASARLTVASL